MERKTIKEVYLAWREMKVRLVKESTFATYVTNAEKHILPVLGDMHSVKESNVQQFVLDKLKAGLSQRTVRDILLVLKMIVAYGHGKDGSNIANGTSSSRQQQRDTSFRFLLLTNSESL